MKTREQKRTKENKRRMAVIAGALLCCICILCVVYWVKKQPYQEIAILGDDNEIIYPMDVDILNEAVVDKYTFFTYETSERIGDNVVAYPVLYRW